MIVRSRPKYISPQKTRIKLNKIDVPDSSLYFNYGRSALMFFFSCFKDYYHKKLRIGLQSFNCPVVMESILQSDNIPVLLDINLQDFSVSLTELSSLENILDILILTSYQGIPPQEYTEISQYCNAKRIFVLEDLSHTIDSSINGIKSGTLSQTSLFSYSFDKPFSSYFGGMLDIKRISDNNFKTYLVRKYNEVTKETHVKTVFDLKMLKILIHYTEPSRYNLKFDICYFFYFPKMVFIFSPILFQLPIFQKIFSFVVSHLLGFKEPSNKITVKRIRNRKIKFLRKQEFEFRYDNKEVEALEVFLVENKLQLTHFNSSDIHWNRYAILDKEKKLLDVLETLGIQAGNYNWPVPMNLMYSGNNSIIFNNRNSYPNSEYACNHIVNIPVWSDFFQKRIERIQNGQ